MLQASRDKNGVYIEPWRFDQMENTLASQGNQVTTPPPPQTIPCLRHGATMFFFSCGLQKVER